MSVFERKFQALLMLICGLLCAASSPNGEADEPAVPCAGSLARIAVLNLSQQFRAEFDQRKRKWNENSDTASRGWWPVGSPNVPFQKQAALTRQMEDLAFRHQALEIYVDLMNETHSLLSRMNEAGISDRRGLAEDVHQHIWGEIRQVIAQPTSPASRPTTEQRNTVAQRLIEMALLVNQTIKIVNDHAYRDTLQEWRHKPEPLSRPEIDRLLDDVEIHRTKLAAIHRKIRALQSFSLTMSLDTTLEPLTITPAP